ncbi:MAG: asparagine synthase (glutamine-hydrolyzing) [Chloroflexi bacterium]|nr:asparagine synthase (glutamine-hydrolyzing) [Chloroflexota bacterium]MQC24386.1 asparagine synthase (glutamine-hydrolyzing) [Chloroflexota bacterium]
MCGICGMLQVGGGAPVNVELLARMRDLIAHRGPDDAGSYVAPDGRVGLANRRLSIIDLSAGGHQPLANEDGTVWIAFNGEIYNYRELRPALLARGHVFASQSDTEVIVHLYEEYGADCVQHLRGMFAFAIWDARRQELFLARDRLGEKPLYYAHAGGCFMFASEIKSLLANPALPRKVKPAALYHYLTFLTPPAPDTLFDGVQKLAAGHCAWIALDGSVRVHEYWNMFAGSVAPASSGDVLEQLRSTLRESIALRMISDVPFGVLLSGGIDSTTNLALMTELLQQPVRSFSIGYAGAGVDEFNELNFARAAARQFGAEHHEVIIGREDLMRFLPDMIYHQDEPIADPVCVPVHYVCKLARESGTKVVQVGEGADELFGGYAHWIAALRLERRLWPMFGSLPGFMRHAVAGLARPLLGELRHEYLRRGAAHEELFWGGAIAFGEAGKQALLTDGFLQQVRGLSSHDPVRAQRRQFEATSPNRDYLTWMSFLDLRMRLPELLLMRVDKMSMATSVEARVPFLDHVFVEQMMQLPQQVKLPGLQPKHLLKQAVRGIIPDEIIDRPKQGFRVPVRQWLAEDLGVLAHDCLRGFCQRTDYFRWPRVQALLRSNNELSWYLLNFALWHELWIEGVPRDELLVPRQPARTQ